MAIEVEVVGSGSFRGAKSNLTAYSVDESITPLDPSIGSPGAGTVTFGAVEVADSVLLMDNQIELRDGARGVASATVRSVGASGGQFEVPNGVLSVVSDSIRVQMNSEQRADPYVGTLGGALSYYLSLVGITGGFQVENALASRPVALPGWRDNVLSRVDELCSAQQIECSVVYDSIVFRAPRQLTATTRRSSSATWSIDRGQPALAVDIAYYNHRQITNSIVYPNNLKEPVDGYTVNYNQSLDPIRLQLSATLSDVNQPTPVGFVGPNYNGTNGVYAVIGNDGLPIPPEEWLAKGGSMRVEIDPEDADYIILYITGMNEYEDIRAPYTVGAVSSGDGNKYSALYITGTGVQYDRQVLRVNTGAINTQNEVGTTIDNFAISSIEQALTGVQKAVFRYSGLNYSISGDAVSLNRDGAGNEFATSKLEAFDSEFDGELLQELDARDWLFQEFDDHYAALVIGQFQNQLFGNGIGARVARGDAQFRIDSTNTSQLSVKYEASPDTLWSDSDNQWGSYLLEDWDAEFQGYKLRDWDIKPLKSPKRELSYLPYPNMFYPDTLYPA